MNIVIDANIFISAAFWGGKPESVVRIAKSNTVDLQMSEPIMEELQDVFSRKKFKMVQSELLAYMDELRHMSTFVIPDELPKDACRDPKDVKYLECATAGNCDYIVSGDDDLLSLHEYRGIQIVSANEFLNICENWR
jgi:putative PIN family toxin of toxin-antitoxin system